LAGEKVFPLREASQQEHYLRRLKIQLQLFKGALTDRSPPATDRLRPLSVLRKVRGRERKKKVCVGSNKTGEPTTV
jgi:hypothetical protein